MAKRRHVPLSQRVREHRGAESLEKYAARLGLSKATVYYIETKQRAPTIGTLRKLGAALGVDWRDLAEMQP